MTIPKKIKIYSLHPNVNNIESLITHYKWDQLAREFEFVWEKENPDFLLISEHIYTNKKINKEFKRMWTDYRILIFYGEEAMKPDLNVFDYGVVFDASFQCNDRIVRIPPPKYMYNNFYISKTEYPKSIADANHLLQQKTMFCNFMYSHPSAKRDEIFHALCNYKKVHSLGKHLHNSNHEPTGYQGHYAETTMLRVPFKFTIAGENAQYRGYTSEKIMTAFQANTIPIYWGNPLIAQDFNEKAFINANNYDNLDDLVRKIQEIDESDDLWCDMVCQPWQTKEQYLLEEKRWDDYLIFFKELFSLDIKDAKRVEPGTHAKYYNDWFRHTKPIYTSLFKRVLIKILN